MNMKYIAEFLICRERTKSQTSVFHVMFKQIFLLLMTPLP